MVFQKESNAGILGFFRSFKHAFWGIVFAISTERNLRIHVTIMAYVLYFGQFFQWSRTEWLLLLLICALVITCELFNTAIENTCDAAEKGYSRSVKTAKDVAAGAVLVIALFAVVIGVFLFWDIPIWQQIIAYFLSPLWRAGVLLLSAIVSLLFIFGWGNQPKNTAPQERKSK